MAKQKTISGPYQTYQIRVSASTLAELQSLSPGVNGAPCFFRDKLEPWYWFETLPAGVTSSNDGSTGATFSTPGGSWVALSVLLTIVAAPTLRFDSITKASAKRLIDAPLSFISLLVPYVTRVYTATVRDYWYWDPLSTAAHDGITIVNPTANGVNAGRFIRLFVYDPYWMLTNRNWYIRPSTGNDENDALSDGAAGALASPEEMARRLGFVAGHKPEWGAGEYHIWMPEGTSTGQNARLYLAGKRSQGTATTIYIHGNVVAGTGTVIFPPTGQTALFDVVTPQNSATNQALTIQCNAIPVSWTASALLTTVGSTLRRIRIIAGSNVGGTMFAKEDAGAKTARMDYPAVGNTYSGTSFSFNTATFTPVAGSSFVVETIPTVVLTTDIDPSVGLVAESCQISLQANTPCNLIVDKGQMFGSTAQGLTGFANSISVNGSRFSGTTSTTTDFPVSRWFDVFNCDFDGSCSLQCITGGNVTRAFINGLSGTLSLINAQHGIASTSNSRARGWLVHSLAITNVPNTTAFNIFDNVAFTALTEVWGSGNAFAPLNLKAGAQLQWPAADIFGGAPPASYFFIAAAVWISVDQAGGNGNTAPAYDTATNTFTAARRTLDATNLQATVAAGGFNGRFFDPVTKCAMVAAQQG